MTTQTTDRLLSMSNGEHIAMAKPLYLPQPAPAHGQIWQEVDPRFDRFIKILCVGEKIEFRTVHKIRGRWCEVLTWRERPLPSHKAKAYRFNGKRGGYRYVEG